MAQMHHDDNHFLPRRREKQLQNVAESSSSWSQISLQAHRYRLAYAVGSFWTSQQQADITSGLRPRPEFCCFAKATGAHILSFSDTGIPEDAPREISLAPRELARIVLSRALAYDAVIASGEDVGLALVHYARDTGNQTPIFVITHGMNLSRPGYAESLRTICAPQIHFLCLSERIRRTLTDTCGISTNCVHNTGYGVDTEFFRPVPRPAAPPLIVSAGSAVRDYETLVAAVDGLAFNVAIAADSCWHPVPVSLPPRVPTNVEVRSYGDYVSLRELYGRASFVTVPLLPVLRASGYAVTIEAMSMGKAVILTETLGGSDFVVHGTTGYYVPPGDAYELRRTIDVLLKDSNHACKMGEAARQRVEGKLSLEHCCERMLRVIISVLQAR